MAGFPAAELAVLFPLKCILDAGYCWKEIKNNTDYNAVDFFAAEMKQFMVNTETGEIDLEVWIRDNTGPAATLVSHLREKACFTVRELPSAIPPKMLHRAGYSLPEILKGRSDVHPVIDELVALGFTKRQAVRAGATKYGIRDLEFLPAWGLGHLGPLLLRTQSMKEVDEKDFLKETLVAVELMSGVVLGCYRLQKGNNYFLLTTHKGRAVDLLLGSAGGGFKHGNMFLQVNLPSNGWFKNGAYPVKRIEVYELVRRVD